MTSSETYRPQLDRVQKQATLWGVVGLALCAVFFFRDRNQFFHSYLFAYVYWIAIPLGSMAILMLHHLTGGRWGYPLRRILEANTRTLGLMAVLFIPIWLGTSHLYPWTNPDAFPDDYLHHFKRVYLSSGFFTVRAIFYFAVLLGLAYILNKWSAEQDQTGDPRLQHKMGYISGPAVVLWAFIVSAAAFDWVMSLEPDWYSTIYGLIFVDVEVLVTLSFVLVIFRMLAKREGPLKDCVRVQDYNDQGNLMLAFLMLWAYLSFDQFLLIYATNLKDEIPWYLTRAFTRWGYVASFLIIFHFFVPFFLLLQRAIKRKLNTLSRVGAFMIVLTLVDIYWLVTPAFDKTGPCFHPMDLFAIVGIGGIWVAAFAWQLKKMPILPVHDPRFEGVLLHEHGD
jgi:hypothetical protein